jgi:hypothetical protein
MPSWRPKRNLPKKRGRFVKKFKKPLTKNSDLT